MDAQIHVNKALARNHAQKIAALLDSKVVAHHKIIVGEAQCPYKVPFHTGDFWFTVLVSDCTCQFKGNHKRGYGAPPSKFCVSFKAAWPTMLTTTKLVSLSHDLGVPVFTCEDKQEEVPADQMQADPLRTLFKQIDFSPVHLAFLNASQLWVWSEFTDASQCAGQARVFRDLLLSIHDISAHDRKV